MKLCPFLIFIPFFVGFCPFLITASNGCPNSFGGPFCNETLVNLTQKEGLPQEFMASDQTIWLEYEQKMNVSENPYTVR
jgi:hypothetical protein